MSVSLSFRLRMAPRVLKRAAMKHASTHAPDERLERLRREMKSAGVEAYVVPSEDPHNSEYAATCFERRQFISLFTGSAGTAVVTASEALLWTDGRYFLQAERELSKHWTLMRAGVPGTPEMAAWLASSLPHSSHVGIDPTLHTAAAARALRVALSLAGHELTPLPSNLVDRVWADRPAPPLQPLRVHAQCWAGETVAAKLGRMRSAISGAGAQLLVVAALDEVAWLFNLRGGDVAHCPVALAYALVTLTDATLFVDAASVTHEVAAHLKESRVSIAPYEGVTAALAAAAAAGLKVYADPQRVSLALFEAATGCVTSGDESATRKGAEAAGAAASTRSKARRRGDKTSASGAAAPLSPEASVRAVHEAPSPIALAKAVKNASELAGMREAHLRDAAALAAFFAWLGPRVADASLPSLSEASAAEHLLQLRATQQGFIEPSFPTIAGVGPNGAVIHYRPIEGACSLLGKNALLLLDSGGQYDCGTTDVTRTTWLGDAPAPSNVRDAFTRVLKGHIALDSAIFPESTPGFVLDALARQHLWAAGLDYRHGTGHGVGAALNVHEGPQGIAPRFGNTTGLQAGMIVSNEPGFYLDGAWGIRIENLLIIKEAKTEFRFGGGVFLAFERLTLVPLQASLLAPELLSSSERAWIDTYHAQVWDAVSPRCEGRALEWLRKHTQPLAVQLAHGAHELVAA